MKNLYFCLVFFFSFSLFAQEKRAIFFNSENKSDFIKINSIDLNVDIAGIAALINMNYEFQINSSEKENAEFVFPINSGSSLIELKIKRKEDTVFLKSNSMEELQKKIRFTNQKGKDISLQQQPDASSIKINLKDLNPKEKINIQIKLYETVQENDLKFRLKIPLLSAKFQKFAPTYNFTTKIIGATPVIRPKTVSHASSHSSDSDWNHTFVSSGKLNKNKDFYLFEFSYAENQINSGLLSYEENGCRYTLGTLQPPKNINEKELSPREYIFIMDTSGSMDGFPIETSKELLIKLLKSLKPSDKFNILFFSGSSDFFADKSVLAEAHQISKALKMIKGKFGSGGTLLNDALEKVYNYPPEKNYNRMIIIITDGDINPNKSLFVSLSSYSSNAQYFGVGIGYEVNRKFFQQFAQATGSQPVLITDYYEAKDKFQKFYETISTPLLQNIKLRSRNIDISDAYPSKFNGFLSNKTSSFIFKECGKEHQNRMINISGKNGKESFDENLKPEKSEDNSHLSALKYFWGLQKIEHLFNEEDRCGEICKKEGRYKKDIIRIGEDLNISTPYTSFAENHSNNNFENDSYIFIQNDFDSDFDGLPNTIDKCPLDKGEKKLNGCPPPLDTKIVNELNRILEGIEFDFDSFKIKPTFYEKLDVAASVMKSFPKNNYIIEGHTDASGTEEYNYILSLNRAKSVQKYLIESGVSPERLIIIGKGMLELKHPECVPVTICDEQKNFENRRVIFRILK